MSNEDAIFVVIVICVYTLGLLLGYGGVCTGGSVVTRSQVGFCFTDSQLVVVRYCTVCSALKLKFEILRLRN